jgi:hypothetical protein
MKALFARAFIAAAVSVLLVMWLGRPVCTGATAGSTHPQFRAFTSMT